MSDPTSGSVTAHAVWDAYFKGGSFNRRVRIAVFDNKPEHDLIVWFHRAAKGIYRIEHDGKMQADLWRGERYGLTESGDGVAHYGFIGEVGGDA